MTWRPCVLCGNPADNSSIYGIGREDLFTNTGPMSAHPVCTSCHQDPAHRLMRHKLHFTHALSKDAAVDTARHLDEMSKAGKDLAL